MPRPLFFSTRARKTSYHLQGLAVPPSCEQIKWRRKKREKIMITVLTEPSASGPVFVVGDGKPYGLNRGRRVSLRDHRFLVLTKNQREREREKESCRDSFPGFLFLLS